MLNLLTSSEQRKLDFIELLQSSEDNWTLSDLASQLDCSTRILQEDIDYFQNNFTDIHVYTSNNGVHLEFEKGKNIEAVYQKLLNDSVAYQFLEMVFLYEGEAIDSLCKKLSVSTSTIYRLIKQINAETEIYDFSIETNPLRVTGNEEHIRYYYYQYFSEKYSYTSWQHKIIDEEVLDQFLQFFIDFTDVPVDFAFYNIFKLVASVNLVRYKNNQLIDTHNIRINFDDIIPNLSHYATVFADFEEKLQMEVSKELINQIFTPYVHEGFSLSSERLFAKAQIDTELTASIEYLDAILTEISEKNAIPLPNKNEVIFALHNASHLEYQEPQSGYILYNSNQHFVDDIQNNFPQFLNSLHQGMKKYRKYLGKRPLEDGINFFIYTVFAFWEELIPELLKKFKHISVSIISDRHTTHGHMIKDFIEYEFSEQFIINIYSDTKVSKQILENLDCDLIVTNFPLPLLKTKEIVYIENVPNLNDLSKLQKAINTIISKRIKSLDA